MHYLVLAHLKKVCQSKTQTILQHLFLKVSNRLLKKISSAEAVSQRCSVKSLFLKNFAKFTEKYLCRSFSRPEASVEHFQWLFLSVGGCCDRIFRLYTETEYGKLLFGRDNSFCGCSSPNLINFCCLGFTNYV